MFKEKSRMERMQEAFNEVNDGEPQFRLDDLVENHEKEQSLVKVFQLVIVPVSKEDHLKLLKQQLLADVAFEQICLAEEIAAMEDGWPVCGACGRHHIGSSK